MAVINLTHIKPATWHFLSQVTPDPLVNQERLDEALDHPETSEIQGDKGSLENNVEHQDRMENQGRGVKMDQTERQDLGDLLDQQDQWDRLGRRVGGDLQVRLVELEPQDSQAHPAGIGMDTLDLQGTRGLLVFRGLLMDARGPREPQGQLGRLVFQDPLGHLDLVVLQVPWDPGELGVRGVQMGAQAGMGEEMDHQVQKVIEVQGVQMVLQVLMVVVDQLGLQALLDHEVLLVHLDLLEDEVSLGHQVELAQQGQPEHLVEASNKQAQRRECVHARVVTKQPSSLFTSL